MLTFFPPSAPFVVPLRIALDAISPVEIVLSLALTVASVFVLFVAGRPDLLGCRAPDRRADEAAGRLAVGAVADGRSRGTPRPPVPRTRCCSPREPGRRTRVAAGAARRAAAPDSTPGAPDGPSRRSSSRRCLLRPRPSTGMEPMALRAVLSGVHALGTPGVPLPVERLAASRPGSRPGRLFPVMGPVTARRGRRSGRSSRPGRRDGRERDPSAGRSASSSANGVTAILIEAETVSALAPR